MAGIYLHIPFCKKACHYCNFHFSTSLQHRNEMVECLHMEAAMQKGYLEGRPVETIYFGGGTPSILAPAAISGLLNTLKAHYAVSPDAEITLEANPDDLTPATLEGLRTAGINRLSIGIQSFFEEDLRWMNRAHNAQQAEECVRQARAAGFDNFSIDLIYGGPTLSDAHWQQNVARAVELGVPHLSCYALTVEPGTALDHFIQHHKMPAIDPDRAAQHFEMLMRWLEAAGYEHYEISNFALPGKRSRHNSSYWQGKPYLGLGPSAHSFNGTSRQWNVANNALYIQGIRKGSPAFEKEILSPQMALNEYIMISLRTEAGCNLDTVAERFGVEKQRQLHAAGKEFIEKGWMREEGAALRLTREGKFFADGIAAAMFF
ncbi:radical SAM family heme chaperone HemW [Chitinophaga lutea]|uniref:Heme chaperone HemW n=1 Tax=Chitinophaga lutea TaxID=2488634 RepID=A0A3N4Q0T0_9BACT|nr:radical SAM family heme chaperone HemW [Chitinophaga lutea]RPE13828.1 radical SAM family heme chaperone HemW [Chitinophaga lutea]